MKIRVTVNIEPIHIDEILEGSSEDDLFHKLREQAASHAPLLVKLALKTMSDQTLRQQIVENYNYEFEANEPIPRTAQEFIAFGERVGFVKRI